MPISVSTIKTVLATQSLALQTDSTNRLVIDEDGRATVSKVSNCEVATLSLVDAGGSNYECTPDFNAANNFSLTMSQGGVTMNNSTDPLVPGQSGCIVITQDVTGSRDIDSWGSEWQFEGGTDPDLTTGGSSSGAVDTLVYYVAAVDKIQAVLLKEFY